MLFPRLHLPTAVLVCSIILLATVRPGDLTKKNHDPKSRIKLFGSTHTSDFVLIPHTDIVTECGSVRPPEELSTPALFSGSNRPGVTISFIVGKDGRVYSPLVLQSGGALQDRPILESLRSWRYRPALCNGVPTEAEATVEFSRR